MTSDLTTKFYDCTLSGRGNFKAGGGLLPSGTADRCSTTVSLLRSRLSRLAFNAIPEWFSSSLPLLFASGRFATFLYSSR